MPDRISKALRNIIEEGVRDIIMAAWAEKERKRKTEIEKSNL